MKRCPKCNRTFPDEAQRFCTVDGGLLITDPTFDPNLTVRATSAELRQAAQTPPDRATSRELPDMGETIAVQPNAATAVFPRNTGPTGVQTASNLSGTSATVPQPQPELAVGATTHPPRPQKKSKLPLILGILAIVFLLGIGGLVAVFFFVIQPRLAQMQERPGVVVEEPPPAVETNPSSVPEETPTPGTEAETEAPFEPSADLVKFENSRNNLDGKLAEHYVPFSFYYPKTWKMDPSTGAGTFARVQKTEEDATGEYLLERASVNWYVSKGSFDEDLPVFPDRVKSLESQISGAYPGYEKVSEGETRVNSLPAYEFRFKGIFKNTGRGDLPYWGRVIFLPRGQGETTGAVITLLATSLASELSGVEDIGVKGEMPVILESFRFGTN